MVMKADQKSSQTQIAQATLDETTQSVKSVITVNGNVVNDTNPLPVVIDSQAITVDVALDKANDSVQVAGTDGTTIRVISTNTSGHVNIADGGNSITVDGTVTANAGTGNFTVVQATAANLNATVTGTVSANQSGTWNIASITNALPTGNNNIGDVDVASLPGTVQSDITAIKTAVELLDNSANSHDSVAVTGGLQILGYASSTIPTPVATGDATRIWTSIYGAVNIADAGGSITVDGTVGVQNAIDYRNRVRLVYTTTNVTTGAWVQLLSAVGGTDIKEVEIFDSSGETLELGVGIAGSEVVKSYIFPGGNGRIPMQILANTRLAIRAVSGTANSGEIVINLYG